MEALLFLLVALRFVICASEPLPEVAGDGPGADTPRVRGLCTTCILVMELLKQRTDGLGGDICDQVWFNSLAKTDYKTCFDVLDAIEAWQEHVERWVTQGCYKKESYGFLRGGADMIAIKPCPSHVICGILANPSTMARTDRADSLLAQESMAQPFCRQSKDEYDNNYFSDEKRASLTKNQQSFSKFSSSSPTGLDAQWSKTNFRPYSVPLFEILKGLPTKHLNPPRTQSLVNEDKW